MSEPKTLRERCEALIAGWRASSLERGHDHIPPAHAANQLADVLADDLAQGPHPESEHAVCLLAIANLQAQLATRTTWASSTHPTCFIDASPAPTSPSPSCGGPF